MKKKIILLVSVITLFVSCKNTEKEEVVDVSGLYSNTWVKEIELNDGNKWQANSETNEGILKMQNSIKTQPTNTLVEYFALVEQLNVDKNYVIKNCTMKGDSHDNLHVWLLPLIAKIDALSEAKTIEDAAKLKQSIEENINGYADYFK